MIKGIVFDFDGVILDTETAEFEAWREVFEQHGADLALDDWIQCVGTTQAVDMHAVLLERARTAVAPRAEVLARQRALAHARVEQSPLLPGVAEWIDAAHARGLPLAIASNSWFEWPHGNLTRLGLRDRFLHLSCFDGVCAGKPDPHLYLAACEAIGVPATEAIAVEDSPDGVRAATAAGLFTVAVPQGLTRGLDLSDADLVVGSLGEVTLAEVLGEAESKRDRSHR